MNGNQTLPVQSPPVRPFRRAVWRGLAVLMPPLLTVMIVLWTVNTTNSYLLQPVTNWAREGFVWSLADVRDDLQLESPDAETATLDGHVYHQLDDGSFIPQEVFDRVRRSPGHPPPLTGKEYYGRYVDLTLLRPYIAIPCFLAMFILLLYFLGKFMAAGIGGFFGNTFDRVVLRLPGVRAVYSAVKQVSDFIFTQREIKFTRIVAVEYPRKGVWSVGFLTSDSFSAIHDEAGEPVVTIFIPYSPMPITGCTITVRKSDCIDLDISFDQACQFIVSCGVVVPPRENEQLAEENGE